MSGCICKQHWGAISNEDDIKDLAGKIDHQPVGSHPQHSVIAAEKRFLCDQHLDSLSCTQSALSENFNLDSPRTLVQLYIDHCFLSQNEADLVLADIPVIGEHDEKEATVTNQMLADSDCGMGQSCDCSD